MIWSSQEIVGSAFDGFRAPGSEIRQNRDVGTQLRKALFHCTPGVTITVISSIQNYKIDASLDVHQHAPNAHMYWIPRNMMLNALSGIAPIS